MGERGALKVVLIFGLMVSMVVNAVVLWDNQGLRLSKGESDKSYQDLLASFDELKASFDVLNQTSWELEIKYSDLEASFLGLFDDPLSPPVSKLQAIMIALEHGGWSSSNLRGMVVTANLKYVRFWVDDGSGYEVLHEVEEPVSDYSPVVEGDTTYRYVWGVTVRELGPGRTIPPPGFYIVDAAMGEIVPWGLH